MPYSLSLSGMCEENLRLRERIEILRREIREREDFKSMIVLSAGPTRDPKQLHPPLMLMDEMIRTEAKMIFMKRLRQDHKMLYERLWTISMAEAKKNLEDRTAKLIKGAFKPSPQVKQETLTEAENKDDDC